MVVNLKQKDKKMWIKKKIQEIYLAKEALEMLYAVFLYLLYNDGYFVWLFIVAALRGAI